MGDVERDLPLADMGASFGPGSREPSPSGAVSAASGFDPSRGFFGAAVRKDVLISDCGKFRYWLIREWDEQRPSLPIIMLNPSTADAEIDDPTIRRCIAFARREGYGGIKVMNLFAFRATSPQEMLAQSNPYGPDNWTHLLDLLVSARVSGVPILCAWGAHGVRGIAKRFQEYAKANRVRLVCLGKTNGGHPRHPLYVKGDQAFEPVARDSGGSGEAGETAQTGSTVGDSAGRETASPKDTSHDQ